MASAPPMRPPGTSHYTSHKSMSSKNTANLRTGRNTGNGNDNNNDNNNTYSTNRNSIDTSRTNHDNHAADNDNDTADTYSATTSNSNNGDGSNTNTPKKNSTNVETLKNINNIDPNKNEHNKTGSGNSIDVDRVVATAREIIRTLSSSQADDMVRILSDFDGRLAIGLHHPELLPGAPQDHHHHRNHHRKSSSLDLTRDLSSPSTFSAPSSPPPPPPPSFSAITQPLDLFPPSLRSAEMTIMRWDINESTSGYGACSSTPLHPNLVLLWSPKRSEEIRAYLHAIDTLHDLTQFPSKTPSFPESSAPSDDHSHLSSSFDELVGKGPSNVMMDLAHLDRAQTLIQSAMFRLEVEFRHLLGQYSGPCTPDLEDWRGKEGEVDGRSGEEDIIPWEVAADLRAMVARMLRSGSSPDVLTHTLVPIRKASLHHTLHSALLHASTLLSAPARPRVSFHDAHKLPWESLKPEAGVWIRAIGALVTSLLPREQRLCHSILAHYSPEFASSCLLDIAKDSVVKLLSFADALSVGHRAPEKLFTILDMYECLQDLIPHIDSIFRRGSTRGLVQAAPQTDVDVCVEASETLGRLGDAARGMFSSFERMAIQHEEGSKVLVRSGGGLLPVVCSVMDYLGLLPKYATTMNRLLWGRKDCQIANPSTYLTTSSKSQSSCEPHSDQGLSSLALATSNLVGALEQKVDAKSKLYKDSALRCLFLMNNLHYIGQKVKGCDVIRKLLGEDWMKRNNGMLKQYHATYRRTWANVLSSLKDDGLNMNRGSISSNIDNSTRNLIKNKFKAFNAAFDENVRTQSGWTVSDHQLCSELIISVTEMILPAYRSFYGHFQNHLDGVKHKERYVKYTPEDLEVQLNSLFGSDS